jgi:hypothetical protein
MKPLKILALSFLCSFSLMSFAFAHSEDGPSNSEVRLELFQWLETEAKRSVAILEGEELAPFLMPDASFDLSFAERFDHYISNPIVGGALSTAAVFGLTQNLEASLYAFGVGFSADVIQVLVRFFGGEERYIRNKSNLNDLEAKAVQRQQELFRSLNNFVAEASDRVASFEKPGDQRAQVKRELRTLKSLSSDLRSFTDELLNSLEPAPVLLLRSQARRAYTALQEKYNPSVLVMETIKFLFLKESAAKVGYFMDPYGNGIRSQKEKTRIRRRIDRRCKAVLNKLKT